MTQRYSLVVFDWDGTLVDSAAHIVASIRAAARAMDLPVPSDGDARHIIGLGLIDAMEYLFPGLDANQYPVVAEHYDGVEARFGNREDGGILLPPDRRPPDAIAVLDLRHVEHRPVLAGDLVHPAHVPAVIDRGRMGPGAGPALGGEGATADGSERAHAEETQESATMLRHGETASEN